MKKNEILPIGATWMEREGIMLSEISQSEKDIPYDFTYIWNLKGQNKQTKQKQTHRYRNKLMVVRWEEGYGTG